MTTDWVKSMTLDYMVTTKMMVAEGKTFWHKEFKEYKTTHLHTPYWMVVLILNRIFGRSYKKFNKFVWIPLI